MYQTEEQRVVITVIGDGEKAVINCLTGFLITPKFRETQSGNADLISLNAVMKAHGRWGCVCKSININPLCI